jgi:hypothetical protein
MLSNIFFEFEENERIIKVLKECGSAIIPQIDDLLGCILVPPSQIDFEKYNGILNKIFEQYIVGQFVNLIEARGVPLANVCP